MSSFGAKLFILSLLVAQNASITLVMRYSRGVLKERYNTTTTVIASEAVKLVICSAILFHKNSFNLRATIQRHFYLIQTSLVMSVPGALYLVQNKLTFVGLQNLDSGTYAILSQLKLLTTALFSVAMMGKRLHQFQWRALLLLFIGVILVQARPQQQHARSLVAPPTIDPSPAASNVMSGDTKLVANKPSSARHLLSFVDLSDTVSPHLLHRSHHRSILQSADKKPLAAAAAAAAVAAATKAATNAVNPPDAAATATATATAPPSASNSASAAAQSLLLGTSAVIGIACLSAFAGVYFEKIVKTQSGSQQLTMWDRNVQLCFFGILFGCLTLLINAEDVEFFKENHFFTHWTIWTCAVVLLASAGGLLVSVVVVYTDNIIKGFATSCAILVTSLISWAVFQDLTIDLTFACGLCAVLMAAINYNENLTKLAVQSQALPNSTSKAVSQSRESAQIGAGASAIPLTPRSREEDEDESRSLLARSDTGPASPAQSRHVKVTIAK